MAKYTVGIDVSKLSLDVAILEEANVTKEFKVTNNIAGYRSILSKLKCELDEVLLCCESTGKYSRDLVKFFCETGHVIAEANPMQVRSFARSRNIRTKTDRMDARLIADYARTMNPRPTVLNDAKNSLQTLTRFRENLMLKLNQLKIELEAFDLPEMQRAIRNIRNTIERQIALVDQKIKALCAQNPLIQSQILLLESIPGVGLKTAQVVIAEMIPEERYTRNRQVGHAGLAPNIKESGTSVRSYSGLCKTGNSRLRKALYMPALVATRRNSIIKTFYQRLLNNGKKKKVALIACMRKLLCLMIGVLNNKSPFSSDWIISNQKSLAT